MPFAGPKKINDLARNASISAAYRGASGNVWEQDGMLGKVSLRGNCGELLNASPTLKVTPSPRGSYRGAFHSP